MSTLGHLAPDSELARLQGLLGEAISCAFAERLTVRGSLVLARRFAIGREYTEHCNFECKRKPLPNGALDGHRIHVTWSRYPFDVVPESPRTEPFGLLSSLNAVQLGSGATERVVRIEVFAHRARSGGFEIHADRALVFTREDDTQFCIFLPDAFDPTIGVSSDASQIESVVKDSTPRAAFAGKVRRPPMC